MKHETRKARKNSHARPRGAKWPGNTWAMHATRTGRRRGKKAWA